MYPAECRNTFLRGVAGAKEDPFQFGGRSIEQRFFYIGLFDCSLRWIFHKTRVRE